MHVHNAVKYHVPDPRYADDTWRAKHGFKEVHQHDAPLRRNRDFKPVTWGAARGMPNARHSEPWLNMKNLYSLWGDQFHHPTLWFKKAVFGAGVGFAYVSVWSFVSPVNGFAAQKLMATIGERPWSGKAYR